CGGADQRCGSGGDDDTLAAIGYGASCPNLENGNCDGPLGDCGDVSDCVACIGEAALDRTTALAFGAPAGTPDARGCQREIAKGLATLVRADVKARARCADAAVRAGGGSCPDAKAASAIAKAVAKLSQRVCARCGGPDRLCGGADDLAPSAIGFPASCPAVTVPGGGPACGGAVSTMTEALACLTCVAAFETSCSTAASAPSGGAYPPECNLGAPAPTATPTPGSAPTRTATPDPGTPTPGAGMATPTATPGGGAPTVSPTPGPSCGNGTVDAGEECDGSDDAACPGQCSPLCGCPAPCTLPNPIPEIVSFQARPGSELDTGWTGIAHDSSTVDDALVAVARLEGCDVSPGSPTCGQCQLDGPVEFPGPAKNCVCFDLANADASSLAFCDPEAAGACAGAETCECFLGPPLPISSGGVPVCVTNRLTGPISGTANIADSGPHAGEGEVADTGDTADEPASPRARRDDRACGCGGGGATGAWVLAAAALLRRNAPLPRRGRGWPKAG
ncbi:MAG: hypothetical protein ACOZNI_15875, partial [Myxococcota bacterium]